jgi:catechol 1,2-dioxygenase
MNERPTFPKLVAAEADVTPTVLDAMADTDDRRLREVMASAVRHLHAFLRETRPTEAEFEAALCWIARCGQLTNDNHNEVVLAADVLGASTLIDLINNDGMQGETLSALLGPFYRGEAPEIGNGGSIVYCDTPGPALIVSGRVTDCDGLPLAGAMLDVWQASPAGLYENQDRAQADFNLRGRLRTDAKGRYAFRSVKPARYPVPTDGPVGDLLRAQKRTPMRPAHIHFIVSAPGHATLITQIFADTPQALAMDVVFGAKPQICGDFVEHAEPDPAHPGVPAPFFTCTYDFRLKPGTPCFPVPPISGKAS